MLKNRTLIKEKQEYIKKLNDLNKQLEDKIKVKEVSYNIITDIVNQIKEAQDHLYFLQIDDDNNFLELVKNNEISSNLISDNEIIYDEIEYTEVYESNPQKLLGYLIDYTRNIELVAIFFKGVSSELIPYSLWLNDISMLDYLRGLVTSHNLIVWDLEKEFENFDNLTNNKERNKF